MVNTDLTALLAFGLQSYTTLNITQNGETVVNEWAINELESIFLISSHIGKLITCERLISWFPKQCTFNLQLWMNFTYSSWWIISFCDTINSTWCFNIAASPMTKMDILLYLTFNQGLVMFFTNFSAYRAT